MLTLEQELNVSNVVCGNRKVSCVSGQCGVWKQKGKLCEWAMWCM